MKKTDSIDTMMAEVHKMDIESVRQDIADYSTANFNTLIRIIKAEHEKRKAALK